MKFYGPCTSVVSLGIMWVLSNPSMFDILLARNIIEEILMLRIISSFYPSICCIRNNLFSLQNEQFLALLQRETVKVDLWVFSKNNLIVLLTTSFSTSCHFTSSVFPLRDTQILLNIDGWWHSWGRVMYNPSCVFDF